MTKLGEAAHLSGPGMVMVEMAVEVNEPLDAERVTIVATPVTNKATEGGEGRKYKKFESFRCHLRRIEK